MLTGHFTIKDDVGMRFVSCESLAQKVDANPNPAANPRRLTSEELNDRSRLIAAILGEKIIAKSDRARARAYADDLLFHVVAAENEIVRLTKERS